MNAQNYHQLLTFLEDIEVKGWWKNYIKAALIKEVWKKYNNALNDEQWNKI